MILTVDDIARTRVHRCHRCGVGVQASDRACADCYDSDGDLMRVWGVTRDDSRARAINHGTAAGYDAHRHRNEVACIACKRAAADRVARARAARRAA